MNTPIEISSENPLQSKYHELIAKLKDSMQDPCESYIKLALQKAEEILGHIDILLKEYNRLYTKHIILPPPVKEHKDLAPLCDGLYILDEPAAILQTEDENNKLQEHMTQARIRALLTSAPSSNAIPSGKIYRNCETMEAAPASSVSNTCAKVEPAASCMAPPPLITRYSRYKPDEQKNIQKQIFNKAKEKILLIENTRRKLSGDSSEVTLDDPKISEKIYAEATRMEEDWLRG